MFVLADVEWITVDNKKAFPTQLSAIKVDENWNETEKFSSYINLGEYGIRDWKHMAYTGAVKEEIKHAKTAFCVLSEFRSWISEEDILVWWHADSCSYFNIWNRRILKNKCINKAISIRKSVYSFFNLEENEKTNSYALAEKAGIDSKPELKHCSENDVRVMLELLRYIGCRQSELVKESEKNMKAEIINSGKNLPYRYIPETNMIHKKDCPLIAKVEEFEGRSSITKAVKKKYTACECCKKEYNAILKEKKRNSIINIGAPYVYSPTSKVFHKCTCGAILSAKEVKGSKNYKSLISSGLKPCKLCNPSPDDARKWIFERYIRKNKKQLPKEVIKALNRRELALEERKRKLSLSKEESEKEFAIKRQENAIKVRSNLISNNQMSASEKKDIYIKTDPYYSFWVAHGYETFHSYGCPKLQGLKNIRGFRTYEEAVAAGYKPCKKCKPSNKKNQKYSIPVDTHIRIDEKLDDIEKYCKEEGYKFFYDDEHVYIETSVGKWKISTDTSPIKLEHMNLVNNPEAKDYHDQHYRFLSFTDVFYYINEHDEKLIKKKAEGKAYLMFFKENEF